MTVQAPVDPTNDDPEAADPTPGRRRPLFGALGPGLIAGASDDDPSGIATYSQAGAQFGYGFGWTMVLTFPLMAALQMICARIGRTTGHGIAGVLRLHAPNWMLQTGVGLLLIANIVNLGADLGAMADAVGLLVPGPRWVYVIGFGALCVYMQVFLRYARYVAILKWLTLALFAYFAVLVMAHVDWVAFVRGALIPSPRLDAEFLTMIVAVLGTTISPYLFFWQAAEEVEDIEAHPRRKQLLDAPEQGPAALARIETDTLVGMGLSNLVALAIMTTTAATLHQTGLAQIETSAQAAEALRPIAGDFAFFAFAIGIVGTGLLAVPVLAGSAAYGVGEARRWPVGFDRRPREAKAFYGTVALATAIGMAIGLSGINPIKALVWSAVLNGVIAVPLMVATMRLAARPDIMGEFAVGGWLAALGWIATAAMAAASVAMLALWLWAG